MLVDILEMLVRPCSLQMEQHFQLLIETMIRSQEIVLKFTWVLGGKLIPIIKKLNTSKNF